MKIRYCHFLFHNQRMASSIKHNKHRNNFNSLKIPASFCLIAYHSSSWLLSSNHMDLLAVSPDSSFLRDISLLFPLPATVYFKYMRVSFLDSLQVSPQMSLCHHTLDHFMWNKADSFPQYPWSINLFFLKMKGELEQTKDKLEQAQNELSAWKFTPDR